MKSSARHPLFVRWTHWLSAIAFLALLVSGVEILISHPRFYWGEAGNVAVEPLFTIPIPASRGSVPTGYNFVLRDQNGWSRSLHFQSAWLVLFTGLFYTGLGLMTRHFTGRMPRQYELSQRWAYWMVVFVLFPLMMWTGLAMAPGWVSIFPATVTLLGGQQSARTIHFVVTALLTIFALGHVGMVWRHGFVRLTRAMIVGEKAERIVG
jgi:thiosulfate reductase cytochrome b subunit